MRIIVDCDLGNGIPGANVDDGLALALAIASPELKIECITTVAGNVTSNIGFAAVHTLLTKLAIDIPVYQGAASALLEPSQPWRTKLAPLTTKHPLFPLWDDVLSIVNPIETIPSAACAIGDLVCRYPGEITIVALGPLTNIAHAMQLYPDFAKSVANIAIMGGVFNLTGYIKDTNFAIDPEAAQIVLNSGAKIMLAPLDATTQTQLLHRDLDKIATLATPLTDYLVNTTRPWINYSMQTRHLPGCWIHDALVVAWLLDHTIATSADYLVDVALLPGITRGSSRRWQPQQLRLTVGMDFSTYHPVTVLEQVDNERLLALLFDVLSQYR